MLSSIDGNIVRTVWHKDFYDNCKSRLSDNEYVAMTDELNKIVKKKRKDKSDIVVSSFIPGSDWSDTVWDPIYTKACGKDEEYSAKFFGLLVCQVLIDREETWFFIKQDIARGMIYFKENEANLLKETDTETITEEKPVASFDDLKNKIGG